MAVGFAQIGSFVSSAPSVTLAFPTTPIPYRIAVAVVDSGHPTFGTIPTCITPGWQFVDSFEGGGGVYGADAGPRRISFWIRALQGDDSDVEPTFTIPAGTDSRVGGVIVNLTFSVGQEVVRYDAAFGEDTSSGTAFSAVSLQNIAWSGNTGDLVLLAYAVATDAATWSAEAIAATGITFGTITERGDSQSTFGADVSRAIATGAPTAGGPSAEEPTISGTLSSASTGVAGVLLVRDLDPDTGPGVITATCDQANGRIQLLATSLDNNATKVRLERSVDQILWVPVRGAYDVPIEYNSRIRDTMSVNFSDSWGTADQTGQTWVTSGGAAADFDKVAGIATIALPDTSTRRGLIGAAYADVEILANIAVNTNLATGAAINGYVVVRSVDASNFYNVRLRFDTDDTVDLFLNQVVAGVTTILESKADIATGYSNGEMFSVRVQVRGNELKAKAWRTTDPEPVDWQVVDNDLAFTSGQTGLQANLNAGNTNVGPGVQFDNFFVNEIGFEHNDYEFTPDVQNFYRITTMNDGMVITDIETTSVTCVIDAIWLKSTTHPFLNQKISVDCAPGAVEFLRSTTPVGRYSRTAVYDIVGRTNPVAVNELMSSRAWQMLLRTNTDDATQTMDFYFASGDVLFIQVPASCRHIPSGYVVVDGGVAYDRPHKRRPSVAIWDAPVREVAPPGPDIFYAEVTWATVLAQYGSWSALLAAHSSWASVLALLPNPSEVIVP